MTPDTSIAPRQCPACGQATPAEATRCGRCQAPLPWGDEVTDAPRPPVADFSLPNVPRGRAAAAGLHGAALVLLCVLLGMTTLGIGFIALPVLIPVFVRLRRKAAEPVNPFRRPARTGFAAWDAATDVAFLVLFSPAILAFAAVCVPIGVACFSAGMGPGGVPSDLAYVGGMAGVLLGLAAAMGASYLVARRFFPLNKDRREGGEP